MGLLEDLKKKKMAKNEAIEDEGPEEEVTETPEEVSESIQSSETPKVESEQPASSGKAVSTGKVFPAQRRRAILGK